MKENPKQHIGKRVKLVSNHGLEDESVEYGVIVNAWYEESIGNVDCYVALYESPSEVGTPGKRPQIYRYAFSSLEVISP